MLLEFYGTGCPHCARMKPLVERLEKEEGVVIEKYETRHNRPVPMQIIKCLNADEARMRAGEALETALREKKQRSISVLLLLSGGSAFSLLENISPEVLDSHITVSVLDERFSKDESINNFAQLMKTSFYQLCYAAGVLFIDTRVKENETQNELAARYEQGLRVWAAEHINGVVIATMGIGADGHTAGIMPFFENPKLFQQLFLNTGNWAAAYDAGDENPYPLRITVTFPFLRERVAEVILLAVGKEKKQAVQRVLAKDGTFADTPARVAREMKNVLFFSDSFS